uniref:Protein MAK16 homolog n=2 Tax=Triticum urartu TaxID=4572 RepID=A0A8R7TR14_TRIUA
MSDEVIWHCLRHNHCSFMAKIETGLFCRNPYNATGICNRSSCPFANSRYATIRDHDGIFYLYMKTAERAHLPNKLWESNYPGMEVIKKHLEHWPELLVHKIKQRLTKMTQYRIRMRRLQLKVREKIMTVPRRKTQRDLQRLEKAEKAAQLEKSIERELIERLRKGVYGGEIHNVPLKQFDTILDMEKDELAPEIEEEEEGEIEYVEGADIEMDEMEDMEDFEGFGG